MHYKLSYRDLVEMMAERGVVPQIDGYDYVGTKMARLFLKKHGINDPKNLKIYVESVSVEGPGLDSSSLNYACSGRGV